jgi:GNAT superfamily N-acetyltransferase
MISIKKIKLPIAGMDALHAEARHEGYRFIDALLDEWATTKNRFDGPGEILCGHLDRGLLVAVGGLNQDPFVGDPTIGRIRRVYVRSAWRNKGIGRALVTTLLEHACVSFRCVRLRTENDDAAGLYERIGFSTIDDPHATHILKFEAPFPTSLNNAST